MSFDGDGSLTRLLDAYRGGDREAFALFVEDFEGGDLVPWSSAAGAF